MNIRGWLSIGAVVAATAANQIWTRLSNGEYVLRASGKCLTEPSTRNSARGTLAACKNAANQHWSLP